MNILFRNTQLSTILAAAILSGCALPKRVPEPDVAAKVSGARSSLPAGVRPPAETSPSPAMQSPDQLVLDEGINLYNNGDYKDAIKRLGGASEIWVTGPKPTQVAALKYMAFSYCVTGRRTLCRKQFEKALKLDPSFDLAAGENGHPLWGPVFALAKKRK